MWHSATCSEPRRASGARPRTVVLGRVSGCALLLLLSVASEVAAQRTLTQQEALRAVFPAPAVIERRTAYLDESQIADARRLSGPGSEIAQAVVTYYAAFRDGEPLGVAYFDAHRVRTLHEVLMVVVEPGGRVARVEVLAFAEPPEYRAPASWLEQFDGRTLEPALNLRRGIVNMTGATLTSEAATSAVRRVLALHSVIEPFAGRP